MPHVSIKHFPKDLTAEQKDRLAQAITDVVTEHFHVSDAAVSIALEPVDKADWNEKVYGPDITANQDRLIKPPGY